MHGEIRNAHYLHKENLTKGQKIADNLTKIAGSWAFIIGFLVTLVLWIAANALSVVFHWDPYPFILLNLMLSCVAAIQAPVILMSQNRQADRDRITAHNDFAVNLKAEAEIKHVAEKLDQLLRLLDADW